MLTISLSFYGKSIKRHAPHNIYWFAIKEDQQAYLCAARLFNDSNIFKTTDEKEDLVYFADVHCNCEVFISRPDMAVPEYSGRGNRPTKAVPSFAPVSVKEIAEDDSIPWNDVVLGIGSKGPIITKDKCIPVVEVRDGGPGKNIWLYIRRLEDGSLKYALCNESMGATIVDIRKPALMRWAIEQCFNECKQHLGMDHYEVRTWHGWYRHILLTLIAHLFVVKMRKQLSVRPRSPGSAPYIDSPVSLDEYLLKTRTSWQCPTSHSRS